MINLKFIKINYALLFYVLTVIISFTIEVLAEVSFTHIIHIALVILFCFGGFLNGITNRSLKSICLPFFINVVVSAINILGIEVFDAYNNFITSSGDFFAGLQITQFIGNLYMTVFIERINHIDDYLLFLYFIPASFIIPYVGFTIGRLFNIKTI